MVTILFIILLFSVQTLAQSAEDIAMLPFAKPLCRLPNLTSEFWAPQLDLLSQWRHVPALQDTETVQLVTHVTYNRAAFLQDICTTWHGPVSVAVYIPLVQGTVYAPTEPGIVLLADVQTMLEQLHKSLQGHCKVTMTVVTEEMPVHNEEWMTGHWFAYPVNAIRNVALDTAEAQLVLLLDADFVTPAGAYEHLHKQLPVLKALTQQQGLIVLPAFSTIARWTNGNVTKERGSAMQWLLSVNSKEDMLTAWIKNKVVKEFSPMYHGDCDYQKWIYSNRLYRIGLSVSEVREQPPGLFEPYVVAQRDLLPKYPEIFRGYNVNKQAYFWLLRKLGFQFFVHPNIFVMHLPHKQQKETENLHESPKTYTVRQIWHVDMREEVAKGSYQIPASNIAGLQAPQQCQ